MGGAQLVVCAARLPVPAVRRRLAMGEYPRVRAVERQVPGQSVRAPAHANPVAEARNNRAVHVFYSVLRLQSF